MKILYLTGWGCSLSNAWGVSKNVGMTMMCSEINAIHKQMLCHAPCTEYVQCAKADKIMKQSQSTCAIIKSANKGHTLLNQE